MRKPIVALGIFGIDEVVVGVEEGVRDFGSDLAGVVRDVEAGDFGDGGFSVDAGLEEGFVAYAAAGDDAEAGHDDAFFGGVEGGGEAGGGGVGGGGWSEGEGGGGAAGD